MPHYPLHSRTWGKTKLGEELLPSNHVPAFHMPRFTPAKMATFDWVASKGHRACPLSSSPSCCSEVIWGQRRQVPGTLGVLQVWPHSSPPLPPSQPLLHSGIPSIPTPIPRCLSLPTKLESPPSPPPLYPVTAAHGAERVCSTGKERLRVPGNKNTDVVVAFVLENPKVSVSDKPGAGVRGHRK